MTRSLVTCIVIALKDASTLMINFRFHVVSLIAIFLALALGVVIGAGVIDRGVVDALDNRLDTRRVRSPSASRARTTCSPVATTS